MKISDLKETTVVDAKSWIPVFYGDRTFKISASALIGQVVLPSTTANDIEITTVGKGIILKSPNGVRWRITIDNSGTLVRTAL